MKKKTTCGEFSNTTQPTNNETETSGGGGVCVCAIFFAIAGVSFFFFVEIFVSFPSDRTSGQLGIPEWSSIQQLGPRT